MRPEPATLAEDNASAQTGVVQRVRRAESSVARDAREGFDDSVTYRGARVRIQTADGGLVDPQVTTRIWAEPGRLLATICRDYTDRLLLDEVESRIGGLMKGQHVEALIALRDGLYDAELAGEASPRSSAPTGPPSIRQAGRGSLAQRRVPLTDDRTSASVCHGGGERTEELFLARDGSGLLGTLDNLIMNIKDSLESITSLDGFFGAALVDAESGMLLGHIGGGPVNLEIAAAGNTEVVRAKHRTMKNLGIDDAIEDILISLGRQYHIIRPLSSHPMVFFYVVLDRSRASLALARLKLASVERELKL